MRSTGNFHPEWGYLAPSPMFIRTARIVLIAVTVGGLVGASVVLSTLERPASETSVAARTLTRPGEVVSVPVGTPPAAQEKVQAVTPDRPPTTAPTDTDASSTQSPTGGAAAPEAPAARASWAKSRSAPSPTRSRLTDKRDDVRVFWKQCGSTHRHGSRRLLSSHDFPGSIKLRLYCSIWLLSLSFSRSSALSDCL